MFDAARGARALKPSGVCAGMMQYMGGRSNFIICRLWVMLDVSVPEHPLMLVAKREGCYCACVGQNCPGNMLRWQALSTPSVPFCGFTLYLFSAFRSCSPSRRQTAFTASRHRGLVASRAHVTQLGGFHGSSWRESPDEPWY